MRRALLLRFVLEADRHEDAAAVTLHEKKHLILRALSAQVFDGLHEPLALTMMSPVRMPLLAARPEDFMTRSPVVSAERDSSSVRGRI